MSRLWRVTPPPMAADRPQDWRSRGACHDHAAVRENINLMMPDGESHATLALPKRICGGCPVQDDCLDWALATNEPHGVWGGLSAHERRDLTITTATIAICTRCGLRYVSYCRVCPRPSVTVGNIIACAREGCDELFTPTNPAQRYHDRRCTERAQSSRIRTYRHQWEHSHA